MVRMNFIGKRGFYNGFIVDLREGIAVVHVRAYGELGIYDVERDSIIELSNSDEKR